MNPISFKRHRFPATVIRQAVWLSFRFTLGLRDVEEMLAERGIEVSHETIRCWTKEFCRKRYSEGTAVPAPTNSAADIVNFCRGSGADRRLGLESGPQDVTLLRELAEAQ